MRARHGQFRRGNPPGANGFHAITNLPPEQAMVAMLVRHGIQWLSTTSSDLVGQLHHLVNRLPPVEPHDELFDVSVQLVSRFDGSCFEQNVDHHRDHRVLPIASQKRESAVEVKQHGAEITTRVGGADPFDFSVGHKSSRLGRSCETQAENGGR